MPLSPLAQSNTITEAPNAEVLALNWLNEQFLSKQRGRVDELTRRHYGEPILLDKDPKKRNLILLQRIIDQNIIPASDKASLQALGVVLGDAFVQQNRALNWRVYHDHLGKSHAVCVNNTKQCLFPVTMLSRRIEVGVKPNVNQVFNDGMQTIKSVLPKLPFSD